MKHNLSYQYLYTPVKADKSAFNLVAAFPGPESFALSSLGYMWLYRLMDEREDINVYPGSIDTIADDLPPDIGAISFSVSFEMDFLNILAILERLKIPVFAKDRKKPLVFAGGPVITSNPAPLSKFFDFFLIGDGEELLGSVVDVLKNNSENEKTAILKKLAKLDGVLVPSLNNTTKKVTHKISRCVYSPVISDKSYFSNTFIMEIERGCYNRCGFCLASYLNLPVRFVPYQEIIDKIEYGLKYTKNIALLGAQISAHPDFDKICNYLISKLENGEEIDINFSSLRVDAVTQDSLKLLKLAGQKTFTIAIEAATERLRRVINKNLKEEQIVNAVKLAANSGLRGIKFYCMLGLPAETDEDIKGFVSLGQKVKQIDKKLDLTFSFSTFIPKPNTPFQRAAREENSSLEKKQKYLTKELAKLGIKTKFTSVKWDYYQTLISRGDESLSDYLYEVYKRGGKLGSYKSAAKDLKIDTDYFVTRTFVADEKLPWDNITIERPGKEFLEKEYKRLMNNTGLE